MLELIRKRACRVGQPWILWLASQRERRRLFVRLLGALQALLFNVHVGEFVRVEDLAAFQTFHKFGIFFAG